MKKEKNKKSKKELEKVEREREVYNNSQAVSTGVKIGSVIFFTLLLIANTLWLYGVTDGKPFVNCYASECKEHLVKTICFIVVSFTTVFVGMFHMYKRYGKMNVLNNIYGYLFFLVFFIIAIFVYGIAQYVETVSGLYKLLLVFLMSSVSIYVYIPIVGIIIVFFPNETSREMKLKKRTSFLLALFFILSMLNFLYINY